MDKKLQEIQDSEIGGDEGFFTEDEFDPEMLDEDL